MPPSAPPGRLMGAGRTADVYEIDADRVLRRYRIPFDVGPEAGLMTYLRQAGFAVPEVFDADGSDLVMARIRGTDMLADLAAPPWRAAQQPRKLPPRHHPPPERAAPPALPRPRVAGSGPEAQRGRTRGAARRREITGAAPRRGR